VSEEIITACLFPDQIVCCGPSPVFVPYSDPGLPLARLVRDRVNAWMDANQMAPKAIVLQNHGLFAIGSTPQQVLSCTLMWDKTARVIAGAMACGGINTLAPEQVERIFTRPDEKFREKMIGGK
jgi:rhamnose utilization protein RhaD (predicted bifunctional aldolase and dehydrogenase)